MGKRMITAFEWNKTKDEFWDGQPFHHVVIDNFFSEDIANQLSDEFPDFNAPYINEYNNPLEIKKTLNHWDRFPPATYRTFISLGDKNSLGFFMEWLIERPDLRFDYGLHGGGWHMHGRGGNNNIHQDYSIHPKLNRQRKLNIIIYLSKDWDPSWGGGLELWSHDENNNAPKEKIKTIDCIFNRAVIFDTTQNSWHGLPNSIMCPEGVIRKSLAGYYTIPVTKDSKVDPRERALFSPREEQKGDPAVEELIKKRADVKQSSEVYKVK